MNRSAGGLLIGASVNQAPHIFRVAILDVPFVDVACTMIDSTLPLTIQEWEEWGNPNEEIFFDYILSYSPIHNVQSALLINMNLWMYTILILKIEKKK